MLSQHLFKGRGGCNGRGQASDGVPSHLFCGGTGIAGVGAGGWQRSSCLFGVYLMWWMSKKKKRKHEIYIPEWPSHSTLPIHPITYLYSLLNAPPSHCLKWEEWRWWAIEMACHVWVTAWWRQPANPFVFGCEGGSWWRWVIQTTPPSCIWVQGRCQWWSIGMQDNDSELII